MSEPSHSREEFVAALVRYGDAVAALQLAMQNRDWETYEELIAEGVAAYRSVMRLAGHEVEEGSDERAA